MPTLRDATPWQRDVFERIVAAAGVGRPEYNGEADDHYKFVKPPICAYIKLTSARTRTLPASALKVIVKAASWNERTDGLTLGNDWHGPETRHMFVTEGASVETIDAAADLIRRAHAHA